MMGMGGQIEDEAVAGLLSVDNAGLLGIIKDEESCQDSDFSGDEKDLGTSGQPNNNEDLPNGAVGAGAAAAQVKKAANASSGGAQATG